MATTIRDLKFLDESNLTLEEQKLIEDILNPANSTSCIELPWYLVSRTSNLDALNKRSSGAAVSSVDHEQKFVPQSTVASQNVLPQSISPQSEVPTSPRNISAETGVSIPAHYTNHPSCVISSTVPYHYPYQVEVPMTPGRADLVTIHQIPSHATYTSHVSSNQEPVHRSEEISSRHQTSNSLSNSDGKNYPEELGTIVNISEKTSALSSESVPMVVPANSSEHLNSAVPASVPFVCGDTIPIPGPGPNFPRMPSFQYQPASHQVAFYAPIYYPGCIPPPTSTGPITTTMASVTNNEWVNNGPNILSVFAVPGISTTNVPNSSWMNNEQTGLPNDVSCTNENISPLTVSTEYQQTEQSTDDCNQEKIDVSAMQRRCEVLDDNGNAKPLMETSSSDEQNNRTDELTVNKNIKDGMLEEKPDAVTNNWNEALQTKSVTINHSTNSTSVSEEPLNKSAFTWADLFKNTKSNHPSVPNQVILSPSTTNADRENSLSTTTKDSEVSSVASINEDELVGVLGKLLQEIKLDHAAPSLKPRGLVNRRNWCYINATLQALLACPPFYNLLKSFPVNMDKEGRKSCTPIMDSLVKFINEFPYTHVPNLQNKEDFPVGSPFEPIYIYKMLSVIKSVCVKGQQEDAEEFLSCILNGLHEEMSAVIKNVENHTSHACNGNVTTNGHLDDSEDEAWQLIGPKNKSMVTRTASMHHSPISDIFGGEIRSILIAGNDHSAFIQPFFTLQLDVQAEKVDSVSGALTQLTAKEPIQDYTCTKTKQEVETYKSILLEKLPPILILHFKRFVYDKDGGCKKVVKKTDYPVELELGKEFLSHEVKRLKHLHTYKLIAVVYHDGEEAVKGHYVADVYHSASDTWLRCDDRNISVITEAQVLRYSPPRVPYLLFYRNVETIRGSLRSK